MPTSDTLEHDIVRISPEQVGVFNLCTDTTRHMNGVVTNMHPSEGVWLFRSSRLILRLICKGSQKRDPHQSHYQHV